MNVLPQYHVVFDNGFTTVGVNDVQTKKAMDFFFDICFKSERWNFREKFEDNVTNRHHFDAIWDAKDDTVAVVESVESTTKSNTAPELVNPASLIKSILKTKNAYRKT